MQINDIKTLVARLGAIVDGWNEQSGAPAVERHIAASLLAELYEAVKFDTALTATEITKAIEEPAPIAESSEVEQMETVSEVIDLSDIFGGSFDDEPTEESVPEEIDEPTEVPTTETEPIEEEVFAPEVEDQPAVEEEIADEQEQPAVEVEIEPEVVEEQTPENEEEPIVEEVQDSDKEVEKIPEREAEETPIITEDQTPAVEEEKSVAEESQPQTKQAALFDMEIVRRPRSSSSRRVIMSLYGSSTVSEEKNEKDEKPTMPKSAPIEEPTVEPEPQIVESPIAVSVAERIAAAQTDGSQQVLGEVIGAGTTTLAEAVAASQPTVQTIQNDRVNSLRNSIGINDRFIMIRDLFGGDGAAFDRAMEELDAFEDFNECLVYMSTYRWNPNSDGARMLMDLVTRKLL